MRQHLTRNELLRGWLVAVCLSGCSAGAEANEDIAKVGQAGSYDLVSRLVDQDSPRGWIIEWKIPELLNPSTAWGVIGQWYNNLESGVYFNGSGWDVYYFGDDNGFTGNAAGCDIIWDSGGICHGALGNLQAGSQVVFKYEFCTTEHVPSVTGTQNCVYVDLKDGAGYRFLAEDSSVRPDGAEMYAHDIENFRDWGYVMPQVSCSAPTKMVRQQIKNSSGSWVTLSGADKWTFAANSPYKFQNQNLAASPANWESCSRTTAAVTVTSNWETGYCVDITVSNSGPGAISSWSLRVDLHDSTMNNNFSANFSPLGGSQYQVTPLFWNSTINAGASQTVGFCGNKTGSNWMPVVVFEDGI